MKELKQQVIIEEHPDIEINYVEDLDTWIEEQVATYPKITTEELASQSGKGIRTIKRHIAKMKKL